MINLYGSRAGTQFSFDKVYPNRYEMDQACQNDDVFIGRYVLVSYEQDKENGNYYTAYLEEVIPNNIADNLAKDVDQYADTALWNGAGWDNTVWQKQFINERYVYVKIADLNSFNFNTIDCGNATFSNDYIVKVPALSNLEFCQIVVGYNIEESNGEAVVLGQDVFMGFVNATFSIIIPDTKTFNGKTYRFNNASSSTNNTVQAIINTNSHLITIQTRPGEILKSGTTSLTIWGEEVNQ